MNARLLAAACALLSSVGVAGAQIIDPDPRFSSIDPVVVGNPIGYAIGGSPPGFDVLMRDQNQAPRPGAFITLRFPAAMKLYAIQNSGTTVDCVQKTLSRVTDAQGRANFAARVGGWTNGNEIEVAADGVVLGYVKGRSLDYNADGRTSLGDFVTFSDDFLNQVTEPKSDFDLNGSTGLGDFVLFSWIFLESAPPQVTCP